MSRFSVYLAAAHGAEAVRMIAWSLEQMRAGYPVVAGFAATIAKRNAKSAAHAAIGAIREGRA